jgi:hypothetical protein
MSVDSEYLSVGEDTAIELTSTNVKPSRRISLSLTSRYTVNMLRRIEAKQFRPSRDTRRRSRDDASPNLERIIPRRDCFTPPVFHF